MSSNYPELTFSDTEDFNADRLNRAMQVLDQRLRSLEPFTPSWEAAVNDLRAVGLSRLNDSLLPAYERIQLLASMGFLSAGSATQLTLVQDQTAIFTIDNETERSLFTPGPFLAITRTSTTADYAIAQFVSYDKITGELWLKVKAITGNPGPHSDWQIGALAGNTLAAMVYLSQIDAARATAVSAKDMSAANATQTAADRVQTGADAASALASKNAAAASAANAAIWDPTNYALKSYVDGKVSDLVNGAGASLDTLQELAAALGNDANYSATITAALGNRLRVDTAAQGLNTTQQSNARTNIGLGASSVKGVATAAFLNSNTGSDVITTDQAWAAAGWVPLGNLSGAVVINGANGSRFYGTLVGPITVSVINMKNGQGLELSFVQDATGGRTISWSGFYFPDGIAPTVYTAANGWAIFYSGFYHPQGFMTGNGWKIN
jgi:hypothetical protein